VSKDTPRLQGDSILTTEKHVPILLVFIVTLQGHKLTGNALFLTNKYDQCSSNTFSLKAAPSLPPPIQGKNSSKAEFFLHYITALREHRLRNNHSMKHQRPQPWFDSPTPLTILISAKSSLYSSRADPFLWWTSCPSCPTSPSPSWSPGPRSRPPAGS